MNIAHDEGLCHCTDGQREPRDWHCNDGYGQEWYDGIVDKILQKGVSQLIPRV